MEITGREFDSFYIPVRELKWRRTRPVSFKITLWILIFLVFPVVQHIK